MSFDKENYKGCASYVIKKIYEINGVEVDVLGQKKSEFVNVFDNVLETIFISFEHNKIDKDGGFELFFYDNLRNIYDIESNLTNVKGL
jgi:hypothetical protein